MMKATIPIVVAAALTIGCAHSMKPSHPTIDNLSRVMVDSVQFERSSLSEVFALVNEHAASITEPPFGPTFALDPDLSDVRLTFSVENIDLAQLVYMIAEVAPVGDLISRGDWIIVRQRMSK